MQTEAGPEAAALRSAVCVCAERPRPLQVALGGSDAADSRTLVSYEPVQMTPPLHVVFPF